MRAGRLLVGTSCIVAVGLVYVGAVADRGSPEGGGGSGAATTLDDYYQGGTQPMMSEFAPMVSAQQCSICHSNFDIEAEPYRVWAATMMGQSARDPLFHALLAISNQVAPDSGDFCIRCHAPVAFVEGRSVPTDMSAFQPIDFEGINCNFCHRVVDQVYVDGVSPSVDEGILDDLAGQALLPPQGSNARYVLDPIDNRRGPFDDIPSNVHIGFPQPEIYHSPHHSTAEFCWTCHDVSNPLMERQPDGTYQLGTLGAEHSTGDQNDMMPLHRTYQEWLNSYYSGPGVQHHGRFGGNHPTGIMKGCQDCHMPDQQAFGCSLGSPFFERPDAPQHSFAGSNYWVLNAIRDLYPDAETGLTQETVDAQIARNVDMLEKATDLELSQYNGTLTARVINRTGHKFPTGFPDGRRAWYSVAFYDGADQLLEEIGIYDYDTATLDATGTTVFEAILGIDATVAAQTGLPEGHTFHFILANEVLKDNRIPPAGFNATISTQNQTASVGATYLSGQNYADLEYDIPQTARRVVVTGYYQLNSREFMEFLRDENTTNGDGQIAYDQYVLHGESAPVVIDMEEIELFAVGDMDQDGCVDVTDMLTFIGFWGPCPPPQFDCFPDFDGDGFIGVGDLLILLGNWGCS